MQISLRAWVMASKLRAARFRSRVLSFEKAIYGVEVRTIGRQEQQPGSFCPDQFFGPLALVEGDFVEDDDVSLRQGRRQLGLYPSLEDAGIHRPVHDPGGDHAMGSQSGDEGLGFPRTKG